MKRSSNKFLHRVRIHGGEFDASARAMHRDGMTSSFQAAAEKLSIATNERKQMSTKTTFKRVALVTVAALGFGLLSTVPSSAATQADSLTLSSATASQLTGETKTAGSAVATVAFLSGATATASGETLSVTAYLTSAPAGNTALPVFAVSDTSSAQVKDDVNVLSTPSVAGAAITTQVAYIAPTANTAAASAKLIVYMNAPTKTGTYVISLVPAVAGGGGVKNALTQTLTITVGTNPTLDTVVTSATSILNVGETVSATTDATVTGSKATMIGATDSATAVAAATIVVTAKNAGGTTVPGTGNAGESLTAVITGSGTLGSAAWPSATLANNGALPTGRAISVKVGDNIAVFADGSSGVGTITITSALGKVLATESVTFYGAIATMTATVEKAAIGLTSTSGVIKVIAKDSAGTVVSSGNVYAASASTTIINPAYASSAISATLGYALVSLTGIAAGTAAITIGDASTAALTTVTAPAVSIRVASGTVADVKVEFDKSSYVPGEKATITVTPVDATGLILYDETYTVFATGGMVPSAAFFTNSDATSSTSAQDGGVAGTGTASGIATYTVYMPLSEGDLTLKWTTAAGLATANKSLARSATVSVKSASGNAAADAANEATDAANAATDAANAAAEAADAATAAAQDAADAVAALSTEVATLIAALKAQITSLTNLVIKIQKKVKA